MVSVMRFGAFVPQGWRMDLKGISPADHWSTMLKVARRSEELGFDSIWVFDHFHTVPVPTNHVTYEAWTLMGALAVTTERVRIGQMCTCNEYRPPSYLAKVAASVDVLSGGRLDMGIGAGWYEHEFLGYGYEFPKPSVRIGRLGEALEIMTRMWREDEVHFDGKHYQLRGAICEPKPVDRIPLWVAGGGEKLTLRLAAQYADYSNFGDDLAQFVAKSKILEEHCRDVGRGFDEIERTSNFTVVIGEDELAVEDNIRRLSDHFRPEVPDERIERTVGVYRAGGGVGTPDQIVEQFKLWEKAGLSYAVCFFPGLASDLSGLELFAKEVIPAFPSPAGEVARNAVWEVR